MSWMIDGPSLHRARKILLSRFVRDEIELAMNDLSIEDPGFALNLPNEIWMQKIFLQLNRSRQLPQLFRGLADRMGGPENEEAAQLLEIVENARPGQSKKSASAVVQSAVIHDFPPPQKEKSRIEPAGPESKEKLVATAGVVQDRPEDEGTSIGPTGPVGKPTKLNRIILLGESTAVSPAAVITSRKALYSELTKVFEENGIPVLDWDDRWSGRQAKASEPEDVHALFVRVVDTDTLNEDVELLIALPKKLGQKLKLPGPLDASQILIWNCDAAGSAVQTGNSVGADHDSIRAGLIGEKLALAEDTIDQLEDVIRSRLRLEKWPPALNLEHPGENKLIEAKLIDVIMSRTKETCKPPYPEMLYLEVTEDQGTENLTAELEGIVSGDAPRDGLIFAIHDLNLDMTDDPKKAIWRVQERVKQYDGILAPILKTRGISADKVIKLAIIMNAADKLPRGRYPYSWMQKDWIIVGMKKIGDTAVLDCADEKVIQKRIDVLLRAG